VPPCHVSEGAEEERTIPDVDDLGRVGVEEGRVGVEEGRVGVGRSGKGREGKGGG
jgi:hypothetical protein